MALPPPAASGEGRGVCVHQPRSRILTYTSPLFQTPSYVSTQGHFWGHPAPTGDMSL